MIIGHGLLAKAFAAFQSAERVLIYAAGVSNSLETDPAAFERELIATRAYWNRRINVALRAYPVLEFVRTMQSLVGRPAAYDLLPKGRHYEVRSPEVESLAERLALDYSDSYLERVLMKYYAKF